MKRIKATITLIQKNKDSLSWKIKGKLTEDMKKQIIEIAFQEQENISGGIIIKGGSCGWGVSF